MLRSRALVTDGGLETDLIYHHGVDLPQFAAFPLLDDPAGQALLAGYYADYAAIAARAGVGLMLESPTWRASPDWGPLLGYSAARLAELNEFSITWLRRLAESYPVDDVMISGMIGPRGDGYRPDHGADRDYHRPQLQAFARAGADLVTAYTITHHEEAVDIVRAARDLGLTVAISFTVETDGRLPSGETVADAITAVDQAAAPDHYLLNCAHPTHLAPALKSDAPWLSRIHGLRCNASTLSHAELDEATDLDDGDPARFAQDHDQLRRRLPELKILGGCCGTDARHVAALWGVDSEDADQRAKAG